MEKTKNMTILLQSDLSRKHSTLDGNLWGIERDSDKPDRLIYIYETLVKLNLPNNFSIVDIAAGRGVVLNGLALAFPECRPEINDIYHYKYDWTKITPRVKFHVEPLQEFIKSQGGYDVVMMLNSYRNWTGDLDGSIQKSFDKWLVNNAKYFITSGSELPYEQGEIRGKDFRRNLQIFKLPLSKI